MLFALLGRARGSSRPESRATLPVRPALPYVTTRKMMYSCDSVVSLIALEVSSRIHHLPQHIHVYMPYCSEQPVTFISFAWHRPSPTSSTKTSQTPRRKSGTMASAPFVAVISWHACSAMGSNWAFVGKHQFVHAGEHGNRCVSVTGFRVQIVQAFLVDMCE